MKAYYDHNNGQIGAYLSILLTIIMADGAYLSIL